MLSTCSVHYGYSEDVYKVAFFFMMPLFIYITGKFSRKSKKPPIKRAFKMLIYFLISDIIINLYYGYVLDIIDPTNNVLAPRYTLWYLLTCTWLHLLEYIIKKIKPKTMLIISIIIAILCGFIPFVGEDLSISRTLTLLPFFVIGYYNKELKVVEFITKFKYLFYVLALIILVYYLLNQDIIRFKDVYMKYSYYEYESILNNFITRIILIPINFIFCITVANLMTKSKCALSNIGDKTLYIYISHGAIVKTLSTMEMFPKNPLIGTILIFLFTVMASLLVHYIIEYSKKYIPKLFNFIKNISFSKRKLQEA